MRPIGDVSRHRRLSSATRVLWYGWYRTLRMSRKMLEAQFETGLLAIAFRAWVERSRQARRTSRPALDQGADSSDAGVVGLTRALRAGEKTAALPLYQFFHPQALNIARRKLRGISTCGGNSAEDLASIALEALLSSIESGRPDVQCSEDARKLLRIVVDRRAKNELRRVINRRKIRPRGEWIVASSTPDGRVYPGDRGRWVLDSDPDQLADSRSRPPDRVVESKDQLEAMRNKLRDERQRRVLDGLERGLSRAEIAKEFGFTGRKSVDRILAQMRDSLRDFDPRRDRA